MAAPAAKVNQGSSFPPMFPPMGRGLGGQLRKLPPHHGGEVEKTPPPSWGGSGENFENPALPNTVFPLKNSISKGLTSLEIRKFSACGGLFPIAFLLFSMLISRKFSACGGLSCRHSLCLQAALAWFAAVQYVPTVRETLACDTK